MQITPVNEVGSHRTGSLRGITVAQINAKLGFAPNVEDDPDKVQYSWGFKVGGVLCGVWDYKGSASVNSFSTYGPAEALRKVFGNHYSPNGY